METENAPGNVVGERCGAVLQIHTMAIHTLGVHHFNTFKRTTKKSKYVQQYNQVVYKNPNVGNRCITTELSKPKSKVTRTQFWALPFIQAALLMVAFD